MVIVIGLSVGRSMPDRDRRHGRPTARARRPGVRHRRRSWHARRAQPVPQLRALFARDRRAGDLLRAGRDPQRDQPGDRRRALRYRRHDPLDDRRAPTSTSSTPPACCSARTRASTSRARSTSRPPTNCALPTAPPSAPATPTASSFTVAAPRRSAFSAPRPRADPGRSVRARGAGWRGVLARRRRRHDRWRQRRRGERR